MEHRLDHELDRKDERLPPWVECDCKDGKIQCGYRHEVVSGVGWLSTPVIVSCPKCDGCGLLCAECGEPWEEGHTCKPWVECDECHGTGHDLFASNPYIDEWVDHKDCEGTGKLCRKCNQPWSEDHECEEV